ncbi:type IV secretion system protein [Helicobacter mehlei]|uniref:VirB8 family protein n=1 Tax=Helicobacter mehlei TaxID=2316080 RepID=A0A553UZX8_9HELI|nr:VirB8/TrbF family protein [Helicobacter mehlei]TSA85750.1 virB8 family protein [Helicobacter mehlei]
MPDSPGTPTPQDLELLLAKIEVSQAQFEQEINSKIESLALQRLDLNSVFRVERKNTAIAYKLIALLAFVSLSQAIALVILLPLKETQHHFVDFANQDKHYAIIQRADESITSNQALVRSLVGTYVLNRESINHIDDQIRYEAVRLQSSQKVWEVFENLVASKHSIYTNAKMDRDIKIINIALLKDSNAQNIASVQIVARLFHEGKLTYEKRYHITLSYAFVTPKLDYEPMPKNPTGFEVNAYSIVELNSLKNP